METSKPYSNSQITTPPRHLYSSGIPTIISSPLLPTLSSPSQSSNSLSNPFNLQSNNFLQKSPTRSQSILDPYSHPQKLTESESRESLFDSKNSGDTPPLNRTWSDELFNKFSSLKLIKRSKSPEIPPLTLP